MDPLDPRRISNVLRSLDLTTMAADLALANGWITEQQRQEALRHHAKTRGSKPIADFLVARGWITSEQQAQLAKTQQLFDEEPAPLPFPENFPRQVGRYRLLQVLGEGGMGLVFRARDEELGRDVALKMLKTAQAFSQVQVERFRREGRNVARLNHPAIVKVLDVGHEGDITFYAMELVSGKPFDTKHGDLAARVRTLEKAARAVQYAHEQGVIHRDLKPDNILVDPAGEPHLLDFGLSRDLDTPDGLTRSAAVLGTPHYMAPEQAEGHARDVDARSDVWPLGVILYEMLAGRVPFDGETMTELVRNVTQSDPPRPAGPADLVTICLKALEKNPARRYGTPGAMADDLARTLKGEPIQARPPGPVYRLRRTVVRHRIKLAMATCLLVAGAAVLWSQRAMPSQEATLDRVDGEVSLVTSEGRVRAQPGRTLESGQGLDTIGERSRATLTYPDGTKISLGGDSRLRLSPGVGKALYLEQGLLTAEVAAEPLVLSTPQAEVRAGEGKFTARAQPTWTRVETRQGTVRLIRNKDGAETEVAAGRYAQAEPGAPLQTQPVPPDGKVPRNGLQLWLKADEGVTAEDGKVVRWADHSGQRKDAFQDQAPLRPRVVKGAIGGKPALQFGPDLRLKLPPGFDDFSAGISTFVVLRPASVRQCYLSLLPRGPRRDMVVVGIFGREVAYQVAEERSVFQGAYVFGAYQSLSLIQAPSGTVTVYRNGASQGSGKIRLPEKIERALNTIGRERDESYGDLAEIVLYNRALSEAERLDVEKYLFEKYLDPALEAPSGKRGVTGEYFSDPAMKDLRERRVDPRPDFQWSAGVQPAVVPAGGRVTWVRWTGFLEPARSGTYTLSLTATGQAKLWIEDRLVVEAAGPDLATVHGKPLALEVGKPVRIRLEASPRIGDSHIRLQWSGPNLPLEVIPQDRFRPQ